VTLNPSTRVDLSTPSWNSTA